ncbi:MAG: thermonuclease family protein [Solirubrobacterales bacterium]|nr:thermonuclease family protein [Solirubrobacterales bacterium]
MDLMPPRSALFWLAVLGAAVFAVARLDVVRGGRDAGGLGTGGVVRPDTRGSNAVGPPLDVTPGQRLSGRVVRVVDGDTVHVRVGGTEETVRYIGLDTPESVKPDTPVECYGKEAGRRNAELVDGRAVALVVGAETRDRYERLLAYVYTTADGRFVNAELLREGFAETLTIPPNDRYAPRFRALANAAKRAKKGLWSAC